MSISTIHEHAIASAHTVSAAHRAGAGSLTLAGECDLACVDAVHQAIQTLLDRETRDIAVDLCGVTFFDCAALGALIHACRLADEHHVPVRVVAAPPAVERLVTLAGYPLPRLDRTA